MIELQRLTKIYPGSEHPAVDGVTLTVPDGRICIFIGPLGLRQNHADAHD